MGKILIIKNADFSENAVGLDKLYDLVKETDAPSLGYPHTTGSSNRFINTIPFAKKVKIYAVSVTLPSDLSSFAQDGIGNLNVGACTGTPTVDLETGKTSISNIDVKSTITTNVNALIRAAAADNDAYAGTTHVIALSEPLVLEIGEYVMVNISGTRFMVYSRTPSGDYGYMQNVNNSTSSNYNIANTFYGIEV